MSEGDIFPRCNFLGKIRGANIFRTPVESNPAIKPEIADTSIDIFLFYRFGLLHNNIQYMLMSIYKNVKLLKVSDFLCQNLLTKAYGICYYIYVSR